MKREARSTRKRNGCDIAVAIVKSVLLVTFMDDQIDADYPSHQVSSGIESSCPCLLTSEGSGRDGPYGGSSQASEDIHGILAQG